MQKTRLLKHDDMPCNCDDHDMILTLLLVIVYILITHPPAHNELENRMSRFERGEMLRTQRRASTPSPAPTPPRTNSPAPHNRASSEPRARRTVRFSDRVERVSTNGTPDSARDRARLMLRDGQGQLLPPSVRAVAHLEPGEAALDQVLDRFCELMQCHCGSRWCTGWHGHPPDVF